MSTSQGFRAFIDATEIPRSGGKAKPLLRKDACRKDPVNGKGTIIHKTQHARGTIMMYLRRVT
ncbi:MAG: hypothetical protein QXW39_10010 [Candidatus Bathyarchaeia archaeon]